MHTKTIECIKVGEITTNCWLYPLSENESNARHATPSGFRPCAVIDPGDEAGRIIARLDALKFVPQYILITHGHFDHIAALPTLAAAYSAGNSPGTENGYPLIAIHRDDAEYLGSDSYTVHHRSFSTVGGEAYVEALWHNMPSPGLTLEEGSVIGPFTVLHLPGHTPGSIGLWDKAAKVLFTGDTLFKGDYGRTDLPGGSEAKIFASLKRLFALDGSIRVYPGHGPATTIGAEAQSLQL